MLGLMRRHSRSLVIKLVYVGLILSFIVWGFGSYQSRQNMVAVDVNGESIYMQDYQRSFENLINYYREQMKDRFNDELIVKLNLKKQALDSLIDRAILRLEAKSLKLKAEKHEITSRIQAYPSFQNKGKFDNDVYFKVLSYNKLKPRDFENEQRDQILMEKVGEVIRKSAVVSEEETLAAYKTEKTKVNLEFIRVTPDRFEKTIKPASNEMEEYFASHVGEFTIPEKINLGYVKFEPKAFIKEINLTKEDYEDYYNSYIDDFTIPSRTRASHILIKFGDDRGKARGKAEDLLKKAQEGEEFSALAKKNSDDTGSAKKGGDLGFFDAGAMVKSFEDAAFALRKGELSDIVETVFGYHIIKVTDITEEKTKALSEVKGEIKKILEAEISAELAQGRAEDIYYEAIKGGKIADLVKEENLPYKTTGLLTLDEAQTKLLNLKDTVRISSTMQPGWVSRPVEDEETFYLLTLLEKEEPREPEFKEVMDEVKKAVIREKAIKVAESTGEKLLEQAKKGASFKKIAKKEGFSMDETGDFSKTSNFIPKLGISQEMVTKAFSLTKEADLADTTFKIGDETILFRLKERKEIKMEEFEKEKELFRAKLLELRREEVYRKWIEEARKKAEIVYHEDLQELQG